MEVTFMPKIRAQSVNFLQKFRGKVTRVDRHSGIMGALRGHSKRYDAMEEQSQIETGRNTKLTAQSLNIHLRSKDNSRVNIKPDEKPQAIEVIHHLNKTRVRKFSRPLKTQQSIHDKENSNCMNFEQTAFLLPKLKSKSTVNSKCINRIKPRVLTRKQSRVWCKDEKKPSDVNNGNQHAQ